MFFGFFNRHKTISFNFDEETVKYVDGVIEDTYYYKVENGKVYLRSDGEEFSETPYAELTGKYMIVTDTYENGTVKIYFEIK